MPLSSSDILPQPFAWMPISAGSVTITTDENLFKEWVSGYPPLLTSQVFEVSPFEIAKYPLTNAQFARFIEAGGYDQCKWWTAAGWEIKTRSGWTVPQFWHDPKWNQADYPVVGVSWYEARAFCRWLSDATGERIILPTEQQWQRAGQGDTNRIVAWGDVVDEDIKSRCNWDANGDVDLSTTPVTQYEGLGGSPFGVVDMTGNVWEWTLSRYRTKEVSSQDKDIRIMKGGGWVMMYSYRTNIRLTDQYPLAAHHRLDYAGFRCARH